VSLLTCRYAFSCVVWLFYGSVSILIMVEFIGSEFIGSDLVALYVLTPPHSSHVT
jgi:hypothetical protein